MTDCLVVCYREIDVCEETGDNLYTSRFMQAGPDTHTSQGVLEFSRYKMLQSTHGDE